MNFSFSFPDDICQQVALYLNWTPTVIMNGKEVSNPIPCVEFCQRKLVDYLGECYKTKVTNDASTLARSQALDAASSSIDAAKKSISSTPPSL